MSLREAYELIKNEDNWTRGTLARTKDCVPVRPASPFAERWCAMGALYKTARDSLYVGINPHELDALNRSANALFPHLSGKSDSIVRVNDNEGHAAVLQCFEKAIVETEGGL